MKKLFLSLASLPLFAVYMVANADEPTSLDEPTTLDAAALDGITAAGSNGGNGHKCRRCGGDKQEVHQEQNGTLSVNALNSNQIAVGAFQSQRQGDTTNNSGNFNSGYF